MSRASSMDEDVTWVGKAGLLAAVLAVAAGVLIAGTAATAAAWFWSRGRR